MKTGKKIFLTIVWLISISQNAQESKEIARFEVLYGQDTGIDITPQMLEANAYLVFYFSDDKEKILLANYWEKRKSQSYGPIYSIISEKFPENEKQFKNEILRFNWDYQNSYDDNIGTAKVKLWIVHKPQGKFFEITIIPENLDVLVYKGKMQGDITILKNYIKK